MMEKDRRFHDFQQKNACSGSDSDDQFGTPNRHKKQSSLIPNQQSSKIGPNHARRDKHQRVKSHFFNNGKLNSFNSRSQNRIDDPDYGRSYSIQNQYINNINVVGGNISAADIKNMLSNQNVQNIQFSENHASIGPQNQVNNNNNYNFVNGEQINSHGTHGLINMDTLCENMFLNPQKSQNLPGIDSNQLIDSQGRDDMQYKRMGSEQKLNNFDRTPTHAQYMQMGTAMNLKSLQSLDSIHQIQKQQSYLQQFNQENANHIGQIKQTMGNIPHINTFQSDQFYDAIGHQDDLAPQQLFQSSNQDINEFQNQMSNQIHLQSSKAFQEQSFKKAHPYNFKSSYINQYSPYIKHEMMEQSNSLQGTEQRNNENWSQTRKEREMAQNQQHSPVNLCNSKKPPMLPSGRSSFKKSKSKNSRVRVDSNADAQNTNSKVYQSQNQNGLNLNFQDLNPQGFMKVAGNFLQILEPMMKNSKQKDGTQNQQQNMNYDQRLKQMQQNSNKKPYELINLSMKRNQEQSNFQINTAQNNQSDISAYFGGYNSSTPTENSATFKAKEQLFTMKQSGNFPKGGLHDALQYVQRSRKGSEDKQKKPLKSVKSHSYDSKTSEAKQKGLFSFQANDKLKQEVKVISRENSECQSQIRKDFSAHMSRLSDNLNQESVHNYDLTTSPKFSVSQRKVKNDMKYNEYFKLDAKRKQGSTSMTKKRQSPHNSLDDGERKGFLGKKRNSSRNSECVNSEHIMNDISKRDKSIQNEENTFDQNFDQQEQSFQTAKSDTLEQSTLGQALMKIGLQIGVHTGSALNTYIKRRKDEKVVSSKGVNGSTGNKSEEEKNSDKSKKSRMSLVSANSAISKKRNAKIVKKYFEKSQNLEKNSAVQLGSNQDQHVSEQEKGAILNKSMCDDAISSSFVLNTSYTPTHQFNPTQPDQEFEGLLQVQPSAYFGGQNDKMYQSQKNLNGCTQNSNQE